jgi:hypothetical protein
MPRQDRRDDELISRDRRYREFDDRDRGAFFGNDRGNGRRRRMGWGSLLDDETSGARRPSHVRSDRHFGPDDERQGIPRDETERLIASNKVEGTPVYDRNGDRMGAVHNFMVDKFRGRVVYAVLKCSTGFLGLDDRYYPLDWDQLTFDTRLGGYRMDIVEDDLQRFGSWDRDERWSEGGTMASRRGGPDRDRGFEREPYSERRRMHDRDYYDRGMRDPW